MEPPGGYADDVALVAVRLAGATPTSFVAALPATFEQTPILRAALRAWMDDLGCDEDLRADVLLGVDEALINAIEHGSRLDAQRTVTVEVFATPSALTATVSDSGRWQNDSAASRREVSRGRGLTLIHALSSHVETSRDIIGTRVTMTYRAPAAGPR